MMQQWSGLPITPPDRCGHGKTWNEDCSACAAVWRKERVADLHVRAAKYGFKLVPLDQDERLLEAGDRIIALISRCSDQATDEQRREHERQAAALRQIWEEAR